MYSNIMLRGEVNKMNGLLIDENEEMIFKQIGADKYAIEDKTNFGISEFSKFEDAENVFNKV